MATMEIKSCISDISKAAEDRRTGVLNREAYLRIMIERVGQSMGGLGGMALGLCIPIPIVRNLVGGTLGGLFGEYAGKRLGRLTAQGVLELNEKFGKQI